MSDALQQQTEQLDLGGPSNVPSLHEQAGIDSVDPYADEAAATEGPHSSYVNGNGSAEEQDAAPTSIKALQAELSRVKDERDSFEGQYHGLLSKLGQMRSTLGDRLRQDAEELDRREQQIDALTAKVDELSQTIQTLEGELVKSHEDVDRLTKELDNARTSLQQQEQDSQQNAASTASSSKGSEIRLRELQEMAERYRIEAESWESACMEERAHRDDLDLQVKEAKRECDEALTREREHAALAQREQETSRGLHQVLEEFQSAQEAELQRAVGEYRERVTRLSDQLQQHEERTQNAEETASKYRAAAERCQSLDKEIKDKNLLIGKLRHEAVILNEHLTESLRRLRANTSDSSVDGKLISNLLIQFLNTPRQDTKRFEMLNLIASVLNWTADERERAGLQQKSLDKRMTQGNAGGKRDNKRAPSTPGGGSNEESFSNLFVEFLLSEAEKAKQPSNASSSTTSTRPSSPTTPKLQGRPSFNLGSLASLNRRSTDDYLQQSGVSSPSSNGPDASHSPQNVRSP